MRVGQSKCHSPKGRVRHDNVVAAGCERLQSPAYLCSVRAGVPAAAGVGLAQVQFRVRVCLHRLIERVKRRVAALNHDVRDQGFGDKFLPIRWLVREHVE